MAAIRGVRSESRSLGSGRVGYARVNSATGRTCWRQARLRSTDAKDEAELQRALVRVHRALLPDDLEAALGQLSQLPGKAAARAVYWSVSER